VPGYRGGQGDRQRRAALVQPHQVQPASLLLELAGKDTIYGGQGEAPAYDWPNPTRAVNRSGALRTMEAPPNRSVTLYVGHDRVYGLDGQVPTYDWQRPTLPVNRTGALRAQDTLDAQNSRFGDVMIGHDRIYDVDGEVPAYDWPNPTRRVDRTSAQRTLEALGSRFANLYTVVQNPLIAVDWPLPVRLRDALSMRRSQEYLTPGPPFRNPSSAQPALGNPVAAQMGTTFTNDLSADGFTWAQGAPSFEDKYGNPICLVQRHNAGTKQHNFVYSNTAGASWTDAGIAETAIDRGACAYDGGHDLIHVAYNGQSVSDGIFYRRYLISYAAGTTQISAIARLDSVSVILDNQQTGETVSYQHPSAIFCPDLPLDGTISQVLVFVYGIYNANVANPGYEIRAVCRVLSYDSADGTAANWRAVHSVGGVPSGDTSAIGNTPVTGTYTAVVANTGGTGVPYPSCVRKAWTGGSLAGSILIVYGRSEASNVLQWAQVRLTWTANQWTKSSASLIEAVTTAGTDAGYSLKLQLCSKLAPDQTNDAFYCAYPVWKSDALGDVLRVRKIALSTLTGPAVDLYAAGASNTDAGRDMFVVGDCHWDEISGALVVAYGDLPRHDVYVATMTTGLALVGAAPLAIPSAFTTAPCDIPTIHPSRVNGRTALVFRDFNVEARNNPPTYTPPYKGWWVTLDWVDPRPQEGSVYWHPSALGLRRGLLDQFVDLQTTLLGGPLATPVLALDWMLPPRAWRRVQQPEQPLTSSLLLLPLPTALYDWPNPVRRRVQPPEQLAGSLAALLFTVQPIPIVPVDWQNPLRRAPTLDLRIHLATGYPLQLRGQDTVYGAPGEAPVYAWVVPPAPRRAVQPEQPLGLLGTLNFVVPPTPLRPLEWVNPARPLIWRSGLNREWAHGVDLDTLATVPPPPAGTAPALIVASFAPTTYLVGVQGPTATPTGWVTRASGIVVAAAAIPVDGATAVGTVSRAAAVVVGADAVAHVWASVAPVPE
jgi:hypothetical protein